MRAQCERANPNNSVSQLLPIIFRISRKMRIQDAGPLTLLRKKAIFSPEVVTIHITKVIPCLACHPSPSALGSLGKSRKITLWCNFEPCHSTVLLGRTVIPIAKQRRWRESASENAISERTSSPVNEVRFNSASCWICRLGSRDLAF